MCVCVRVSACWGHKCSEEEAVSHMVQLNSLGNVSNQGANLSGSLSRTTHWPPFSGLLGSSWLVFMEVRCNCNANPSP